MQYPMSYGYSLVGRVQSVGDGVDPSHLGQRVFCFSPHASFAVVDAASAMRVPEGISAEDAAFLPAVETAVSLVMALRPLIGERVAVVGQGLIGLLAAAVLNEMQISATLVDVNPQRLSAAAQLVLSASLLDPSKVSCLLACYIPIRYMHMPYLPIAIIRHIYICDTSFLHSPLLLILP